MIQSCLPERSTRFAPLALDSVYSCPEQSTRSFNERLNSSSLFVVEHSAALHRGAGYQFQMQMFG
jgi:hypothetical protein